MVCHSRAANWVLGLTEMQMNKVHDYGGVHDEQLRTLEHLGVFRVNWTEHVGTVRQRAEGWLGLGRLLADVIGTGLAAPRSAVPAPAGRTLDEIGLAFPRLYDAEDVKILDPLRPLDEWLGRAPHYTTLLPKRPNEYRRLADPTDAKADLDVRARSYLQANCAQCHVAAGGGNALMDLEFTTPRKDAHLYEAIPQHHTFGVADPRLIAPGARPIRPVAARSAGAVRTRCRRSPPPSWMRWVCVCCGNGSRR